MIGRDLDEAIALVTSIGPAGEILRLAGDRAAHLHGDIDAALRKGPRNSRPTVRSARPRQRGSLWQRRPRSHEPCTRRKRALVSVSLDTSGAS